MLLLSERELVELATRPRLLDQAVEERTEAGLRDAAVECPFTIEIAYPFPRDHCLEMRRSELADPPLRHCEIRNAVGRDGTAAPDLRCAPFDDIVEILGFHLRHRRDAAARAGGSACCGLDHDIAVRDPEAGIGRLPGGIERGVVLAERVGSARRHGGGNVNRILAVDVERHDDRESAFLRWTEDVGIEHRSVTHCDGDILFEDHAFVAVVHRAHHDVVAARLRLARVRGLEQIRILVGIHRLDRVLGHASFPVRLRSPCRQRRYFRIHNDSGG